MRKKFQQQDSENKCDNREKILGIVLYEIKEIIKP